MNTARGAGGLHHDIDPLHFVHISPLRRKCKASEAETEFVDAQCPAHPATGWKRIDMHPSIHTEAPCNKQHQPISNEMAVACWRKCPLIEWFTAWRPLATLELKFSGMQSVTLSKNLAPHKQCHMLASCSIVRQSKQDITCHNSWLFCTHCLVKQWYYQEF